MDKMCIAVMTNQLNPAINFLGSFKESSANVE